MIQVEDCKETEKKLKDDILLLWSRLSIDQERRESFLSELSQSIVKNIPKVWYAF